MLRFCRPYLVACNKKNQFALGALSAMKLHLQHRSILEEDHTQSSQQELATIERDFKRQIELLRAHFTLYQSMEVGKFYSAKLFSALKHFEMTSDPMYLQLQLMLGRKQMNERPKSTIFKTDRRNRATDDALDKTHKFQVQLDKLDEGAPEDMFNELPAPFKGTVPEGESSMPKRAVKFHRKYRGHWILRDPEIAITRAQRRHDPW